MMIDGLMNVPYLRVMTFEALNHKWIVISQKGLSYCRLERHLERKAWVASFGRPKMTSQSLLASQTGLSPYLRWGCLIFLSSLIFGFIVYFLDTCDERKNQSTGSRQAVLRSSALFSGSGSPQLWRYRTCYKIYFKFSYFVFGSEKFKSTKKIIGI